MEGGESTPVTINLRERLPLLGVVFAVLVALGTTQTWVRILFVAVDGTEADRGLITLAAALVGAAVCAFRAFARMDDRLYYALVVACAALMLAMPVWFYLDITNEPEDPDGFIEGNLMSASGGLYFTIIASVAYSALIAWSLIRPWVRRATPGAAEPPVAPPV